MVLWPFGKTRAAPVSEPYVMSEQQRQANERAMRRCVTCGHISASHIFRIISYYNVYPECAECYPANFVPHGREIAVTHEYVEMVEAARHDFATSADSPS